MVSIILCTYNRAALLPKAIRSVLRQTTTQWELIVIDDGSTDDTASIVHHFQSKDKRILYHFQTNKGLAKGRNAGIHRSLGKFLCFIDSDDEFTPEHLELRILYFKNHPSIDFLHGGMKLVGPKKKQYVVDLTDTSKKIHLSKCHVGGTFFFRRTVLRFARTFRPIPFGEDFDFYQRVSFRCSIRKVRYPTYIYHLDSENRLCDIYTEKLLQESSEK